MMFHSVYAVIDGIVGKARDHYYAKLRHYDLTLLWPECCAQAPDLDHAKMVFAVHAYADPAWLHLGRQGIFDIIDKLECPPKDKIKCPQCGRVSHNPNDIKNRYCGHCHLFHNTL